MVKRKEDYDLKLKLPGNGTSKCLRSFFLLGLYMLVFLSPFWRGLYFEQDLLPAVVLASIAFILCIVDQILVKDFDFFREPLDIAMAVLLGAYILSLVTAVHRHDAIVELLKISSLVMVYWMAVRAGKDERAFSRVLLAAYLAAVGMAVVGLGAALGWIHFAGAYEDGHIRSTLQYHNALAIYLAAMNVVGLALSLRTDRLLPRLVLAGGNFLLVMVILGSLSRGTWLLYPVAMGLFIYLIPASYRRTATYQLLIVVITGLLAGRFFFNNLSSYQPAAVLFMLLGLLVAMAASTVGISLPVSKHPWVGKGTIIVLVLLAIFFIANPSALSGVMRYIVPDTAIARAEKTSVQDSSFQERLTAYQDALKIKKDHPLTGTGGGGWKALYHSYASHLYSVNEVHNYYLQTWVAAGLLGFLALFALAVFFIRKLIRIRTLQMEDHERVLLWSAAVAVIIIALHSIIDFELSMAAVGFLFFGLIGLVRGRELESELEERDTTGRQKRGKGKQAGKPNSFLFMGAFAGLLALATGITALCLHNASLQGEKGNQALQAGRLDEAQKFYMKAGSLDPYRGAYQVNLAQIAAIKANKKNDRQFGDKALYYADRASQLEPYNPVLHNALYSIYGMLGRVGLQLSELEAAIRSNPFVPQPYELMAATAMKEAWPCLDQGRSDEAFSYFKLIVATHDKMPPDVAASTAGFNLAAGQSALLLGETDLAKNYLNLAVQGEENISKTARLWLAGADYLEGQNKTAKQGVDLNKLFVFLQQQKNSE